MVVGHFYTAHLIDAVGAEERARIAKAEGDVSNPVFVKKKMQIHTHVENECSQKRRENKIKASKSS